MIIKKNKLIVETKQPIKSTLINIVKQLVAGATKRKKKKRGRCLGSEKKEKKYDNETRKVKNTDTSAELAA